MKKNYYIVVVRYEYNGYNAFMLKHNGCNNLKNIFEDKTIVSANICDTKLECQNIVKAWNEAYKKNGTYSKF